MVTSRVAAASVGGLPRVFWFLFAGQLVNRFGNMVVTFLVFYLSARGLPAARIGVVLAVLGAGGVLSQPLGGLLADRAGRRFTLVAGMVATAGCLVFLGAARAFPTLVAAAGLLGLVGDVYRPASAALIADHVPRARRVKAFGLIFWAINLGYPLAGTAGGLLTAHGYGPLFAVDAGTCLLFAAIIWIGVPRDVRHRRPAAAGGYRTALRDRLFLAFVLLTVVYGAVYAQAMVGVPLALRDDGLPPSAYAVIPVVNGVLIVVLQPVAGPWLARRAPLRMLAAAWALVGLGMGLTGLAGTPAQYAMTAAVWTLGEIGAGGLMGSVVADLAPAGAQGRYQAVFGFGTGLSKLAASAAGAAVYAAPGPGALWGGCAGLGAACALGAVLLAPAVRLRIDNEEEH